MDDFPKTDYSVIGDFVAHSRIRCATEKLTRITITTTLIRKYNNVVLERCDRDEKSALGSVKKNQHKKSQVTFAGHQKNLKK